MAKPSGFVYVIESPSASDLLDGRTEGQALCGVLDLAEIPRSYSLVTNLDTLSSALTSRLVEAWERFGVLPVLHLSLHGNEDGVGLTDGTFVTWDQLRRTLRPITD